MSIEDLVKTKNLKFQNEVIELTGNFEKNPTNYVVEVVNEVNQPLTLVGNDGSTSEVNLMYNDSGVNTSFQKYIVLPIAALNVTDASNTSIEGIFTDR